MLSRGNTRIVDEFGEDYLYSTLRCRPRDGLGSVGTARAAARADVSRDGGSGPGLSFGRGWPVASLRGDRASRTQSKERYALSG